MGFDVTKKCNLYCRMCYWWNDRDLDEFSLNESMEFFKQKKKEGIYVCIYVGGEPTLRPDLLQECTSIIPRNIIVTNGTNELPELKNTVFGLSVDGTEKIHDKIRRKGLYKEISNRFSGRDDTTITTTLINLNKNEPEKIVKEWSKTKVRGIFFNFATPFTDSENEFFISLKERERLIDKLLLLKKEYTDFILLTEEQISSFRESELKERAKSSVDRIKTNIPLLLFHKIPINFKDFVWF